MKRLGALVFVAVAAVMFSGKQSEALPIFRIEFEEVYGNPNETFLEVIKESQCDVCHYGQSKKNHNDYGLALSEFLDMNNYRPARVRAEQEEVKKEIRDAFLRVEKMESSKDGQTFGELLKAGELPGTVPEGAEEAEEDTATAE